jgi:hypothetical protein
LEDTIWELYPEDTWALSNLDKVDATQQYHEWQTDTLAGATINRQLEGDDATFATLAPTVRMGNYLQISRKTFLVSGSVEASRMAGRKSELARNARKLMRELKRDMEQALIGNQNSTAGTVGGARSSGGMESFIFGPTQNAGTASNVIRATTTADACTTQGFSGTTVSAPVDGSTTGALSNTALNSALQGAWEDGGDPRVILCSANNKAAIDNFTSIATRFVDIDVAQAPIIGAANVYVSDFGRHTVILSRYIRTSVVLCLDPEYWAVAYLRRPFVEDLAKTGDGMKKQIISEFTLVARNPASSAKVVACA